MTVFSIAVQACRISLRFVKALWDLKWNKLNQRIVDIPKNILDWKTIILLSDSYFGYQSFASLKFRTCWNGPKQFFHNANCDQSRESNKTQLLFFFFAVMQSLMVIYVVFLIVFGARLNTSMVMWCHVQVLQGEGEKRAVGWPAPWSCHPGVWKVWRTEHRPEPLYLSEFASFSLNSADNKLFDHKCELLFTHPCLPQLVGVRIPDHPFMRQLCQMCGEPLALTSANISSQTSTVEVHVSTFCFFQFQVC